MLIIVFTTRHQCARRRFDSCARRNRLPAATSTHIGAQESARGEDGDNNRGGQLAQQLDAGDRPSAALAIGAAIVL